MLELYQELIASQACSTKLNKLTLFYGQTSNVADDDDEDDTQVTYRSSLPELKNINGGAIKY